MKLSGLNQWLTLIANFAVLIGIVVVVIELRQNQVSMQAEASTIRTEMAIASVDYMGSVPFEMLIKIENGWVGPITLEDQILVNPMNTKLLRYFENLHYQYQLEIIDDEIWQANLNGISAFCGTLTIFQPHIFSDAPNDTFLYRASFIELLRSTCVE